MSREWEAANIGTAADAPWSGAGAGTLIADLKRLVQTGGILRITAGGPAPGQSIKTIVLNRFPLTAAPQTINWYVVTALKTLYLTDICLYTTSATLEDIQLQAGGGNVFRGNVRDLAPIQMPGIETQPQGAAGSQMAIVVPADTGMFLSGFISGFEQ